MFRLTIAFLLITMLCPPLGLALAFVSLAAYGLARALDAPDRRRRQQWARSW